MVKRLRNIPSLFSSTLMMMMIEVLSSSFQSDIRMRPRIYNLWERKEGKKYGLSRVCNGLTFWFLLFILTMC